MKHCCREDSKEGNIILPLLSHHLFMTRLQRSPLRGEEMTDGSDRLSSPGKTRVVSASDNDLARIPALNGSIRALMFPLETNLDALELTEIDIVMSEGLF